MRVCALPALLTGRMRNHLPIGLLVFASLAPAPAAAQDTGSTVSVSDIVLSADTVEIGDLVDLSFVLDLAPGTIAFLPDSLEASDLESFEPVAWQAAPGSEGGVRLSVTYRLIAFQVGGVMVPELPVFVGRASEAVSAGFANEGDLVGGWAQFRQEPSEVPSARILLIPARPLWVASVLDIEDASNGVQPRPLTDVVGGARHWPATLMTVAFAVLLMWAAVTSARALWLRARNRPQPAPDPRLTALAALDALLAEGAHRTGEIRGFYDRASHIVRRFVEDFDQRWGPAHTSTELMRDLEQVATSAPSLPDPDPLVATMDHAEAVKFGGDRPAPEEAEQDLRTVRSWVESAGPP